jgi:hypothetical protein
MKVMRQVRMKLIQIPAASLRGASSRQVVARWNCVAGMGFALSKWVSQRRK